MARPIVRLLCPLMAFSILRSEEHVNLDAVHRLRTEAFENSRVMEHAFFLTDVHGPRLTNSPGFRAAADWTVKRLREMGLDNVKLEKWGPYGRGWSYTRFAVHIVEPVSQPVIGFPMAWSPGTQGPVTAEVILAPMREAADFERYKGKLKDKIVLIDQPRGTPLRLQALGQRRSQSDLDELALNPDNPQAAPAEPTQPPTGPAGTPRRIGPTSEPRRTPTDSAAARRRAAQRNEFLKKEGALAMVSTGYNGDGGTVFASYAGAYDAKYPDPPTAIVITPEHYNRMVRLLERKMTVKMEIDVKAEFHEADKDSFNIIGEIAGTSKRDEVVIIGAHFDSWHGGTGATDNAAGSAVMIEAMRLLKSLDAKMDRTVRIALWSGEENGLLGSRAYVKEHFADPATMKRNDQHGKLAAYFNVDNGTGRVRGVYLQNNDMVRPIFAAWLAPFRDLGANTLAIRNTRGTDHLSFNEVGLPGFQFIQDQAEYETRTHHSNMDVYDHLQEADLKQASAIVASFAYHAAMRPEMLPRKPLPKPTPPPRQTEEKKNASTGTAGN